MLDAAAALAQPHLHVGLVVLVLLTGVVFAWINGMHDVSNAVATSFATGSLSPRYALPMSAGLTVVGALLGVQLAERMARGLVHPGGAEALGGSDGVAGAWLAIVALLVAGSWSVLTWWWGIPSSSSQALVGAVAGAGLALGWHPGAHHLLVWLVLPMLVWPVIALIGGRVTMWAALWLFRDAAHEKAVRGFRAAQAITAATISVGQGYEHGQRVMGVLVIGLGGAGALDQSLRLADGLGSQGSVPGLVRMVAALALGAGALAGGWRLTRTVARRLVRLTPATGFSAGATVSLVLYVSTTVAGAPASSSHTTVAAIVGAGSTSGVSAVRWGTVRQVIAIGLLTPAVTFAASYALLALPVWLSGVL